jgi:nucleotide-binding universal stress UspA family protein
MQARKILFPTDFSEASESAWRMAQDLAAETGAMLVIVHVHSPPAYSGSEMYYLAPPSDDAALRQRLQSLVPSDPTVRHGHCLLTGDPASEILRLAEEEQVDLIVMGTHGRTGLLRLLQGSVAEAVVRRASCPVITVKHAPELVASGA